MEIKSSYKKQRGFTIGEAMLVGVLAALAAGAAFAGFGKQMFGNKSKDLADGLVTIVTGVQGKFGQLGSYASVSNTAVIANEIVTKPFKTSGTTINTNTDGTVTLASVSGGSAFGTTVTNVPKAACSDVVAKLAGVLSGVAVLDSIGGTPPDVSSAATTGVVKAMGATLDEVKTTTQCAADTNGDGHVEIYAVSR